MALSPEVLKAVLSEVGEYVAVLQTELVEESMPVEDPSTLDNLYRAAHTLKGLAGAAELRELHQLSTAIELVVSQARSGAVVIAGTVGAVLRDASAACADLAGGDASQAVDVGALVQRLEGVESSAPTRRVLFHTTSAPAAYTESSSRPFDPQSES